MPDHCYSDQELLDQARLSILLLKYNPNALEPSEVRIHLLQSQEWLEFCREATCLAQQLYVEEVLYANCK